MTDQTRRGNRPAMAPLALQQLSPVQLPVMRVLAVASAAAEAVLCSSPRGTAASEAGTPPLTPTLRRKHAGAGDEVHALGAGLSFKPATAPSTPRVLKQQQGAATAKAASGRRPAAVVFGGGVLLLMLVGLVGSGLHLRLTKWGTMVIPAPRFSFASFNGKDLAVTKQQGGGTSWLPESQGSDAASSGAGGGITALISSAAATVAEQLGAGSYISQQEQGGQGASDGGAAGAARAGTTVVPTAPPTWQLRCAVMNNLVFHIDVMAGWTYAFQSAGCDVTVYQNEQSMGIEEIMSAWLTGRFRKPELFPGEAGDYHIVILPTFRDQHAELVQYLLQLPRLERQRYFLTQHNPDWLLNHPNVDILQQQLLLPLLDAGHAVQEAENNSSPGSDGKEAATPAAAKRPLLRIQVATLAPCVSNYTLFFLRDMAFNLTEGQTYAERVGSFRVRSGLGSGGEHWDKDNSHELRRWVAEVIDVEVPWLAPLVPWQPTWTSVSGDRGAADAGSDGNGEEALAGLLLGRRRLFKKGAKVGGGGKDSRGKKQGKREKADVKKDESEGDASSKEAAVLAAPLLGTPPPPPPGAEAIALLRELNLHGGGGREPRHVCIQGKLENSRRNYSAAFEALSHPAVMHQLRTSGERLLLLGHRSKWETVVVPKSVQDVVVVLASLPYTMFFDMLSRCRAILLAFATDEYYIKKSSSTIATAINVGVPLIAERRTLQAYGFLQPESCFVYDDEHAPRVPGQGSSSSTGSRSSSADDGGSSEGGDAGTVGEARSRNLLKTKKAAGEEKEAVGTEEKQKQKEADRQAAADEMHQREEEEQQEEREEERQQQTETQQHGSTGSADGEAARDNPPPRSYSAAILAALRSESSAAAHEAMKRLKAEVMSHNSAVAAAFMAATEAQYSAAERGKDAAQWHARLQERAAAEAAGGGGAEW